MKNKYYYITVIAIIIIVVIVLVVALSKNGGLSDSDSKVDDNEYLILQAYSSIEATISWETNADHQRTNEVFSGEWVKTFTKEEAETIITDSLSFLIFANSSSEEQIVGNCSVTLAGNQIISKQIQQQYYLSTNCSVTQEDWNVNNAE